jgi:Sigma-70, region 4
MPATKYNTRRLPEVIAREQQVIAWVGECVPFTEIANRMGVTEQRVRQIHKRGLLRFPAANVEEHRTIQLERIHTAIREMFELARNPKASYTARALLYGGIKAWSDREAKLMGLDMPTRSEVKVVTESTIDAAIHDLQAEMALQAQQAGIPLPELP